MAVQAMNAVTPYETTMPRRPLLRSLAHWVSLVLVFTVPWENAVVIPGLGTLTKGLGLVLAAAWLAAVLTSGRIRKPYPFHIVFWCFLCLNVASGFWTFGLDETVQGIKTVGQMAVLVWVLWDLYNTHSALESALQAYVLGTYVAIGSTIANFVHDVRLSEIDTARYTGAGLDANELALMLAIGVVVAWYLGVVSPRKGRNLVLRILNWVNIPLALAAILLTASRTALFSIIPAILFALATLARVRLLPRLAILIVAAGAVIALSRVIPASSISRLMTIKGDVSAGSLGGRIAIWQEGIGIFSQHPLIGVGAAAFRVAAVVSRGVAHNTFLSVLG